MIGSLVVLVVFQIAGGVLVAVTHLPLPGPVVGLVLLALALVIGPKGRQWRRERLQPSADGLLVLLPLLFVPAGVGVIAYLPVLWAHIGALAAALLISAAATLLVTALLLNSLLRRRARA
ncbi:CidA/LrgA family protein [Nakamurella sp. YIM 132087]|uniref:CidA/LrgA family protein n=1 Tax=Nakamurella alba TaxID=2665158 RepID=A0A7K1FJ34_9ACTN|nr:CidA/LrgA family protein [Nakamurella alba]